MAGPIATAYVLIKAKLDPKFGEQINREVDAELKKIEGQAERSFRGVSTAADKAVRSVDKSLGAVGTAAVEAFGEAAKAGDSAADSIERSFDGVRADLERGIDVEINTAQAIADSKNAAEQIRAQITRLETEVGDALTVNIDADTSAAQAQIAALNKKLALINRHIEINVDVDADRAGRSLGGLFGLFGTAGRGADGMTKSLNGATRGFGSLAVKAVASLGAIVPVGPTLVGVAAAATALVGAVGLAAGSLVTAGASASSLILAFAALKVGMTGVGDAMSAQIEANKELAETGAISAATQEKLAESLKKLAPAAQEAVKTFAGLSDEYAKLRKAVQQELFAGQAANIKKVDGAYRGLLQDTLSKAAGVFNDAADSATKFLTSADGKNTMSQILNGMVDNLKALIPAFGNVASGMLTLLGGAQENATGLSNSFLDVTQRFEDFADRVASNGALKDFLTRAQDAAGSLMGVIGGLARVLGGVFGAGAGIGVSMLETFADRLNSLADTIKSVEGQDALAGFFSNIAVAGQAFSDVMGVIKPVLGGLGDVLSGLSGPLDRLREALLPLATTLGEAIGSALEVVAPKMSELADSIVDVVGPIADAVTDLVEAFSPLADFFLGISFDAINVLADGLAEILSHQAVVDVLVALVAALVAYQALSKIAAISAAITAAITAQGIAAGIAAIGTGALAGAMALLASPFILIGAAIVGVVALFVLLYKHSDTVRTILDKIGGFLKTVFIGAIEGVSKAIAWLKDNFEKLKPLLWLLLGPIGAVILAFRHFDKIKAILENVFDAIGPLIGKALVWFGGLFVKLGGIIAKGAGLLLKFFGSMFAKVGKFIAKGVVLWLKFLVTLPLQIFKLLKKVLPLALAAFRMLFAKVAPLIAKGVATILKFFLSLPGKVLSALASLGSKLWGLFKTALVKLGNVVLQGIVAVVRFYASLPGRIISVLQTIGARLSALFQSAFELLRGFIVTGITRIIGFFAALPGRIFGALRTLGSKTKAAFVTAFGAVSQFVADKVDDIVSTFRRLPEKIRALGGSLKEAGKSIMTKFMNGLRSLGSGAAGVGKSIANGVIGFLNTAIHKLNGLLEFTIKLPGLKDVHVDAPDIGDIPKFAKGGVLDKATLALVAEAGREAIIPLERGSGRIRELVQESGLMNLLNEKDFYSLVAPRLGATLGQTKTPSVQRVLSDPRSQSLSVDRSTNRSAPTNNVRSTVVKNEFILTATNDPAQQAEQIARRLTAIMER